MSYKTYNEYDNSDIIWAKQMPSHWKTNKFKVVFSYSKGKNPQSFFDEKEEGLLPYLSMEYLRNDITPTYVPVKECPLRADVGDILLLWDGSNAGEFVISKAGLVSSTMAKLTPNIPIDKDFSKYLCKLIEPTLRELTIGMGVPHVSSTELNNIILPNIPLDEQKQIAYYLDKKTTKIDETIFKNQQLIELLEEKKIALINQVVTKGLNPSVPMKDSGVEWIGEIPEHWNVVPLTKFLESTVDYRGKTPEKVDDGIFLVTGKNIKKGNIDYNLSQEFVKEEDYDKIMSRGKPKLGDLLFTTEAPLGEVANIDNPKVALAQRIIKMCGKENVLNNYYLKYYMMSATFQSHLQSLATGSTAQGIKASKLFMLKLLLMPYQEQQDIAQYLNDNTKKIDNIIYKVNKNINLLEEYKTSLIHHVVTGKIDVRSEEI